MPEYRKNSITGDWVIIAADRAGRPETFCQRSENKKVRSADLDKTAECPFCYGNEDQTPPEIVAWRDGSPPNTPGWKVRVVPNKYPAASLKGPPEPWTAKGVFQEMAGYGIHEVLIETPQHNRHPGELSLHQTELIIKSYFHRFVDLARDGSLMSVQIFRNHGREAGASIEHPHSQLVALPCATPVLLKEMREAQRFYLEKGRCPYCLLLEEELSSGARIIIEDESFVAFVPYAARMPFELWIVPRRHQSSFSEINEAEQKVMALFVMKVLHVIKATLDDPPYNYYLHSAPLRALSLPYYHWHLEIFPRVTVPGGFEMGTGVYINVTVPEEAAQFLRERKECFEKHAENSNVFYSGVTQSPAGGEFS